MGRLASGCHRLRRRRVRRLLDAGKCAARLAGLRQERHADDRLSLQDALVLLVERWRMAGDVWRGCLRGLAFPGQGWTDGQGAPRMRRAHAARDPGCISSEISKNIISQHPEWDDDWIDFTVYLIEESVAKTLELDFRLKTGPSAFETTKQSVRNDLRFEDCEKTSELKCSIDLIDEQIKMTKDYLSNYNKYVAESILKCSKGK